MKKIGTSIINFPVNLKTTIGNLPYNIVSFFSAVYLLIIFFFTLFATQFYRFTYSWKVRRIVNNQQNEITGSEFLQVIGQMNSLSLGIRFVRMVRTQKQLVVTNDEVIAINKLTLAVEHNVIKTANKIASRKNARTVPSYMNQVKYLREYQNGQLELSSNGLPKVLVSEFMIVRSDDERVIRRLNPLSDKFLDELCILLEQIRSSP